MLLFLGIIALVIWLITVMWKFLEQYIEVQGAYTIVAKIDQIYDEWLSRNRIFDDSIGGVGADIDRDIPAEDTRVDDLRKTAAYHWSRLTQTGGLIAFYMVICNILVHWGSWPELIVGSLMGVGISCLHGDVSKNYFIQKFAGVAFIMPLTLIVIRNFVDTYRMGLWIFSLSAMQLYLTQWLGVFAYYLVNRSMEHHEYKRNIFIIWCLIVFTIIIL